MNVYSLAELAVAVFFMRSDGGKRTIVPLSFIGVKAQSNRGCRLIECRLSSR
jgi:hypothetical protein